MYRQGSYSSSNADFLFVPLTLMEYKELWRTHFRIEILAEDLRQRLEINPLFNLVDAFQICDQNKIGKITRNDIR